MRVFIICLTIILMTYNDGASQSSRELRKEKRAERKANKAKLRSPLMVYPLYWGIQDTRTSPGIYRVFGPGISLKSQTTRPNLIIADDFQFNLGIGTPNFNSGALQYNFLLSYDIHFLKPISPNTQIGLTGYALNHNRLIPALNNSSYAMEVAFGIGPVARYERSVRILKKDTDLSITGAIPIVSHLVRIPEFGLSFNGPSHRFAPVGNFTKVSIKVNAERQHRKSTENRINYFYRWDYYGTNEFEGLHRLRVASHQIGFHLWIKKN